MKNMTEQMPLEYKIYRAACRESNVEPVLADFLAGEIPDSVIYHMELEQNERTDYCALPKLLFPYAKLCSQWSVSWTSWMKNKLR